MEYKVIFSQYHTYHVEADDEDEAFDLAHDEFVADMRRPIARTSWDEVEIEEESE